MTRKCCLSEKQNLSSFNLFMIFSLFLIIMIQLTGFSVDSAEIPNIIPIPKSIVQTGKDLLVKSADKNTVIVISDNPSEEELTVADCLNNEIYDDYLLNFSVKKISELSDEELKKNFLVVFGWSDFFPASKLIPETAKKIVDNLKKSENPQFYTLFSGIENGIEYVAFSGKNAKSSIYGATSFVQMIKKNGSSYFCPGVEITDYPDFKFRWAMRSSNKEALRYKINIAPYFGIYEKFKPETNEYLEANRYGRKIGILPLCGFYGNFNLKNRESYPDGKIYPCIGAKGNITQNEGYYTTYSNETCVRGFCMSNPELLRLKCDSIKTFVENNEPVCVYIHYHDRDSYARASVEWKNRCAKCRENYPDDNLETEKGKAKGMADEINSLLESIYSVKKESGYDASRDCLVLLVLAPYMRWSESNEDFAKETLFYTNISKNLNYTNNVNFVLREQFYGEDGKLRIKTLSEILKKNGKGHGIFIYYHGGDTRTSFRKWPLLHAIDFNWLATPVLMSVFEGAENGFIQLASPNVSLIAEYLWNMKSPSVNYQIPSSQKDIISAWTSLRSGSLPEEIFGKGKFFDKVYQNRYGLESGTVLADAFRPEYFNKTVILYPETSSISFIKYIDTAWGSSDSPELQEKWKILFEEIKRKNISLLEAIKKAVQRNDFKEGRKEELMQIKKNCETNLVWLSFCIKEADFYIASEKTNIEKLKQMCDELLKKLKDIPNAPRDMVKEKEKRLKNALESAARPKEAREIYSKEVAAAIMQDVKKELASKENYNLQEKKKNLEVFRFLVIDDGKQHLKEKLGKLGMKHLEFCKSINDDIMQYDVVLYMGKSKLNAGQYDTVRNFISSGRGFFIFSASPYFMCGSGKLSNISDWFGALDYGNLSGNIKTPSNSFITDGMENWISEFSTKKGSPVIMSLTTGFPILVSKDNSSYVFMFANKYKKGRVFYSSMIDIPDDMMLKILLWLCYNRI